MNLYLQKMKVEMTKGHALIEAYKMTDDFKASVRKKMPIKILLADDQRLFRQGLKSLLGQEGDFKVVGEAANGQDAINLTQETNPDIILMDVNIPELDSIDAVSMILKRHPNISILMLSICYEDERIIAAIKSGASGYIMKDAEHKEFIKIIKDTFTKKKDNLAVFG